MPKLEVLNPQGLVANLLDANEVHEKGLLHSAVHCLVQNSKGEIFVRQRPSSKKVYKELWTSSVGAHILPDQTTGQAVLENLSSYLGVTGVLPIFIGESHIKDKHENEMVKFFLIQAEEIPLLNTGQSQDGGFMKVEDVRKLIIAGEATPHLAEAIKFL